MATTPKYLMVVTYEDGGAVATLTKDGRKSPVYQARRSNSVAAVRACLGGVGAFRLATHGPKAISVETSKTGRRAVVDVTIIYPACDGEELPLDGIFNGAVLP